MSACTTACLEQVDALHGFALLGILAVNIWSFADPYYASSVSNPAYASGLDHLVRWLVSVLFETKFYRLFSFLFGYSFTLQMASAERSGERFVPRMLRRQLALLVTGLIHGTLLFYGEILSLYAMLGLILLMLRGLSPRRATTLAVLLFSGYGLGLVNHLAPLWIPLLVIAIYLLQMQPSVLCLRSQQYGPCEWLLRAVPISAWQPKPEADTGR